METVAVVGVGLIGGSFALALRRAGFAGRMLGVSSARTLGEALHLGVIDEGVTLAEAAARADLMFLAQPILRIVETISELGPMVRPGCLVTDAGSTKRQIAEAGAAHLPAGQFLGGHPMAGKEARGVAAADAELFRGRPWVLTPAQRPDLETPRAVEYCHWLDRIGAVKLTLAPGEHDATVALTSHLPQLASSAMAATISRLLGGERARLVAGPGLIDATRLALSPFEIWADILATNEGRVGEALDAYIAVLQWLRSVVGTEGAGECFEEGSKFAGQIRQF